MAQLRPAAHDPACRCGEARSSGAQRSSMPLWIRLQAERPHFQEQEVLAVDVAKHQLHGSAEVGDGYWCALWFGRSSRRFIGRA